MAGVIGKRNDEEKREEKTLLAWECWEYDPVTHNASRVEAEGTDNHANSRTDTHAHGHILPSSTRTTEKAKAKYKPGHEC